MSRTRALLVGTAAFAAYGAYIAMADAGTVQTEGQKLGDGVAQVYAELDAEGAPRALGVSFDPGMLEGLPTMPNTWSRCFDKNGNGRIDEHGECNGDYELRFALPPEVTQHANTPFKWVSVNWNPMGHPAPAPPVWAVPHFDFHFYIMPAEAVAKLRPGPCSELMSGGGPGPSCTNPYPNSTESAQVDSLWAYGFSASTFDQKAAFSR